MRIPHLGVEEVYRYACRRFCDSAAWFFPAVLSLALPFSSAAQTPVLTQHNNNARSGTYTTETILTPANVNQATFGKLFSYHVDGHIYGQPLYVPNVAIAGKGTHNVTFIVTEHDSVYAFDADSNGGANAIPLWQITLLDAAHGAAAGATTVPNGNVSTSDIVPEIGITSTPVIDANSGTLYVVGKTLEGSSYFQRLHALDITSGAEKFAGPVAISGSVPGTGNGSSGGVLNFDPLWNNQRAGLLLQNGVVYIGFGSHGDNGPWHGWLFAYNATTLQKISVFCATPNGAGSGMWMSGSGLAADIIDPVNHPYGRLFVATGNGSFNATTPYTSAMNFGDDILRFDLTGGVLTIQDSFTPFNQGSLNSSDQDLASGGVMLLPDQTGAHTHMLTQIGKQGLLYLVDRDNLGGYNSSTDNVVQEIPGETGGHWSTPAFWNNFLYTWGSGNFLRQFTLSGGALSNPSTSTGSQSSAFPGATPAVSSNGNSNGIVWAIQTDGYNAPTPAILRAYNANNLSPELYDSTQNAARDAAGPANKFAVPTIANGKVYVGTASELDVYGLLSAVTPAATPLISPGSKSFSGSLSVSITDSTAGATIYYTTDGSTPTVASAVYTAAITVTSTETVNAIASAPGFTQSAVASAAYTLLNQVAAPIFSPVSTSFSSPITVTISSTTPGATIYYTADGSTPTTSSTLYSSGVSVSVSTTLKAIAAASGMVNSTVSTAVYTSASGGTGSDFVNGFSSAATYMALNGSTGLNDSRLQLTDGGGYEAGSAWFNTPVNIQTFTNDFTFQIANPGADGFTFTIQNAGLSALGGQGGGLGYGPNPSGGDTTRIANSVAIKFDICDNSGEGADSTGLFTNGASPTIPAVDLTNTGIDLHSGDTFSVHMVYDGTTLTMTITDGVTNASYTTSWTVNIPQIVGGNSAYVGFTGGTGGLTASQKIETWTFTPTSHSSPQAATPLFGLAAGTYLGTQTVSISDATPGATIFYTIDGSTPATSVGGTTAQYSAPISVTASETINAIATAPSYSPSLVGSAAYTIESQTAAPSFAPLPGTYGAAQSVTISSVTSGASIYYTLDGSTPATSVGGSTFLYSAPIVVGTTTTIKAVAIASGYFASNVSTASYIISAGGGGSINFANGFVAGGMVFNGSAALNGARLRINDGNGYESASAWYSTPVSVLAFTNNFSFQITPGTSPTGDGIAFVIQNNNTAARGGVGGGLGYGPNPNTSDTTKIPNSVAVKFDLSSNSGEGVNSTGIFTNGASPTIPFVDLTSTGIDLHSGHIFNVAMTYDGSNLVMTITDSVTAAAFTQSWPINIASTIGSTTGYFGFTGGTGGYTAIQDIVSWTYSSGSSTQQTVATPTFSPVAGTYPSAQNVTLSDTTSGATIYYTTDGSTPTTSSTKYIAAIPVSAATTTTINAIATATGYNNSAVASAAYTIQTAAATPSFSPSAGTYASTQNVTLSDTTSGATIYYTTDGSTPTTSSTKYTAAIPVSVTTTINAIAAATGFNNSAVASATFTIQLPTATPTFSPVAGTYPSAQNVTLSDTTSGATIYYTTDGSTPTTSSTKYTAAIPVSVTTTIKAIATATGFSTSAVGSAAYSISTPTSINFAGGFTSTGMQFNGGSALNGTRLRITDGGTNEARSAFWTTPVNIQNFTSDFTFQLASGTTPTGEGFAFVLQNSGVSAIGPKGGGLGYGATATNGTLGIPASFALKFDLYNTAGEGINSTGIYLNGASPSMPAVTLSSSGIDLHSGHVFSAHVTYNGANLALTLTDTTTAASFNYSWPVDIPVAIGSTTAYAGFTGSTSSATAIQDVITWSYSATPGKTPIFYEAKNLSAVSSGPTFRTFTWSGFPDGTGTILDATAVGDSVTLTLNVATAGTYYVAYSSKEYTSRGMTQLSINGTNTGPVADQYATTEMSGAFDLGTFNFAAPGTYSFKFTVTGKNASSTGYTVSFDEIVLTPQ